jgi:transcription-repair coupling factor (superfamily II helicase)
MAARDLSVIKTPPPNRQPVDTQIIGFNEEILRDAISYEIQRDGQVYFINNRIENLKDIAGLIQRLVPDARELQVTDKWTEKNWKPEFSILWKENMMFWFLPRL